MPLPLSKAIGSIPSSSTLAVSARAKAMKADGADVVNFGVGEPDFDTPEPIRRAGCAAIESGQTRYTPAAGTPDLRRAVAERYGKVYGVEAAPENVVVSSGAKSSLFLALGALVNPGDEVIVPAPYWLSYPQIIAAAGAAPKIVTTTEAEGFKLTPAALKAAVGPRTKAVILNSPSNPTGAVYTKDELAALAEAIDEAGIYAISDEIYEELVYGGAEHWCLTQVRPQLADRAVIVSGVSKTYAMTGWRIGYAVGPKAIVTPMTRFQSHVMGNPCSISQAAALEALTGDQSDVRRMREVFDERRRHIVTRAAGMKRVTLFEPQGAFYAFLNIADAMAHLGIATSTDFTMRFLEEKQVAAVGGADFGAEGYLRFSYATSMEQIEKGLERLEAFIG